MTCGRARSRVPELTQIVYHIYTNCQVQNGKSFVWWELGTGSCAVILGRMTLQDPGGDEDAWEFGVRL